MPRIDGVEDADASFIQKMVFRTAAAQVGDVPEPLRIMAKSSATMWSAGLFQMAFDRASTVSPRLKTLACLKTASMVGCVF